MLSYQKIILDKYLSDLLSLGFHGEYATGIGVAGAVRAWCIV